MNAELTSGTRLTEVNPGDPLYRDLQLRGYNRRVVGTPDSVFVVADTDQVVNAVDAVVASGKEARGAQWRPLYGGVRRRSRRPVRD